MPPHMLRDSLTSALSEEELSRVYSAFDVIGDIVIIKVPDDLDSKKALIANAILKNIKQAKTVFAQVSAVKGEYRIRELEFLAGENNSVTEYKEHGCRFKVDVARTYFSPRLSTERLRIAEMVQDGERVVNMFGGVGTFSIIIARKNKTAIVYNIDSNPNASELCELNARLNKVQDRVVSICGDAASVIRGQFADRCSRVIMPLPERAREFVDSACLALKGQGIVHYFAHVKSDSKKAAEQKAIEETKNAFANYAHEVMSVRTVREVGPRLYQIVSDVAVRKV
jgi:tRNA (guanine37-N1)-methyltransferase